MKKLLTNAGESVRAQAIIYKAMVQMVLLYGSERWVFMVTVLEVIEGFRHRVARQITVNTDQCDWYGGL